MADQAPQYLDAQGNPITARQAASAPKTLDAQGNPPAESSSPLGRLFSGAWQNMNPLPMIEAIVDQAARNRMAIGMGMGMSDQYDKARTAPTRTEQIGHGVAAALPGIGPAAAGAGESIAAGDYAGGIGQGLGLVLPIAGGSYAPKLIGRAAEGVGRARSAAAAPAELALEALLKKTGLNQEAIDLQTARMRMQTMRSRARQIRLAQEIADAHGPIPSEFHGSIPNTPASPPEPVVSKPPNRAETRMGELVQKFGGKAPIATPSAASAPAETASAGSAATGLDLTTARTPTIEGLLRRWAERTSLQLTAPELDTGVALVRQGAKPSEVVEAIAHHRNSPVPTGSDAAAEQFMNNVGLPMNPETGGPQHARGVTGKYKVRPTGD